MSTTSNTTNTVVKTILSKTNRNKNTTSSSSSASSIILYIIQKEIRRDGGSCLVTSIKDYVRDIYGISGKRFNSLLVYNNTTKKPPKLLSFLEHHNTIFDVNRQSIPHWVKLRTLMKEEEDDGDDETETEEEKRILTTLLKRKAPIKYDTIKEKFRLQTYQKALYVLRKRQARIERRNNNGDANDVDDAGGSNDKQQRQQQQQHSNNDFDEKNSVNIHWLLRQCCWEYHNFLRLDGYYMKVYSNPNHVQPVGTIEWENIVKEQFEIFLAQEQEQQQQQQQQQQSASVSDHESILQQEQQPRILVQNGKAVLEKQRQQLDTKESDNIQSDNQDEDIQASKSRGDNKNKNNNNNNNEHDGDDDIDFIRQIDTILSDIILHRDGGHQISLGLLYHRYPQIKQLLGGRDLYKLYQQYQGGDYFKNVSMFHSQHSHEVIVQSKKPKTNHHHHTGDDDDDDGTGKEKRMKVDEEGLYSVTNTKWGRAMANLMIHACRQTNLFDDDNAEDGKTTTEKSSSSPSPPQRRRVVVDLTASVGGMTLGLARSNYFDEIIALEIDPKRAELCEENMTKHGFQHLVRVENKDSVQEISLLPRQVCFVIDPPWGGFDYKQLNRQEERKGRKNHLKLGETYLEDILEQIANCHAPCVVGLRLPVTYNIQNLLDCLTEKDQKNIHFKCITIRKIAVQLVAVIYFSSTPIEEDKSESIPRM